MDMEEGKMTRKVMKTEFLYDGSYIEKLKDWQIFPSQIASQCVKEKETMETSESCASILVHILFCLLLAF